MATPSRPARRAVIGSPANFWIHSPRGGFDLTHPLSSTSPPTIPRLHLNTTTIPITISPAKTALLIIDMQNFFLSEAFGRPRGAGHAAAEQLLKYAIPAARRAGIQVVWLCWGLDEGDLAAMPPGVKRAFGFEAVVGKEGDGAEGAAAKTEGVSGSRNALAPQPHGVGVDKHGHALLENGKDRRIYRGLGAPCGTVALSSGEQVDAGRLLMRDTWNAALYDLLHQAYTEGTKLRHNPDVWIHKNRMSGLWGGGGACHAFLQERGIRTLLFAGVNTDQCVSGTATDAFNLGYDCVLLRDACGTTSPGFAQECIEFNAARTWGFVAGCEELVRGVEEMDMESAREMET